MDEHFAIDFDGDKFCPPPTEQNAIVIWEELATKYPKFWFSDISLKASGNYVTSFAPENRPSCHGSHVIGNISIGEDISIKLNEIPLGETSEDLSVGNWNWILADPTSLDKFFRVMDSIYSGFHQFREGQTIQLGRLAGIEDVLTKDQATKKLFMRAADIVRAPYNRDFIARLQNQLNDPQFNSATTDPNDWRAHITLEVRENWHFLDELARLLFWVNAMTQVPINDPDA